MGSRLELHEEFKKILGSNNVYYQPPETLKMEYPAIVYFRSDIDVKRADNIGYNTCNRYNVVVISKLPDHPAIDAIIKMPMAVYDRHYSADNLNHDSISLYY